jgi:hypothetical protein
MGALVPLALAALVPRVLRLDYGEKARCRATYSSPRCGGFSKATEYQLRSLDSCVSTLLGHAKLSTAQIYIRVSVG